jgi:hypothetical protein
LTGRDRFFDACRRIASPPKPEMPRPTSQWEAWAEYRLCQIETWQTWIVRLLLGSLAVQVGLKIIDLIK